MRLKTIELSGFKSFVDPTRIELGPGITSIVGPNGCGKSNIVDALRWVLGEHSARHLRGGVMDDLIFQGSETRPPVAVCDVELTFAVEKGQLPPPYHELEEIRVRRRLTRDGGSDAFINGKMVRIKDVVDLFLDTGVSTRAYAIVEQGAIARMVTARPDERRQIFEEAAGVMKYRARRRESERKMRDTRQNLDRVRDLLDEVRKQCRSLKQQAARAERFRAMQEELERARTQVLARRWRQASQQVADTHRECAALEAEERECARAQSACEQRVQRVRDALLRHEERAQQAHERVRAVERKRAELQRESERRAARRQLLAERLKATRVRLQEGKARMRRLDEELAELAAQRKSLSDQQLKQQLRQAEVEVAQAQQAHAQAEQRYRECFAAYERLRHRHETAGKERRRLEARVRQREQRCAQLEAKLARLNEEAQALAQSLTDAEAEHGKRSEALATVRQAMEAQGQRLRASEESYRQCASELEDCERRLRKLRGDEQELRARLENQAVSQPLRARLRACGGVWLDESLDVPEGMEAAVAAVLRGRDADVHLPLTVIEDNALWRELASQPLAIHVPVECQPVDHSLAQAMGMDRAHPMFSLFDGIALVEHIRDAIGRPFPCVSVDGWRYEPPGWLMPPADRRMARRFALRRRLRACMLALDEATHAVEQARMRSAEAKTRHQQAQREWEHRRLALIDAEQGLKRAAGEEERLRQQHRALRQRQAMLEEDLRIEREEWTRCREQCAEITQLDASELARAEAELAEQQQRAQALLARVDEWRQRQAAAQQALALFRQQDDNLRAQIRRTQAQQARLQTQCTQDEALLREHERALAQLQEDHSLDQLLMRCETEVEQAHRVLAELRQEGHELQQQLHAAEREERAQRARAQASGKRREEVALRLAAQQARLKDLEAEISLRCRLAPDELVRRVPETQEQDDTLAARCRTLEERLERFGPVNLLAIEEHEQAEARASFLAEQVADLERSLNTLNETIERIDRTMRQRFRAVFEQTNEIFQRTFPRLFGGGRAELRLDSDDVLRAGVEVIAQPPGKRLQDVGLLSGGEKALTAVALVFSIFQIKPAPFCVLDEVDAPLDDANVDRFGRMLRELSDRVQFLAISHNKITMQHADRLIGVSMPEPGVSRIIGVELET